MLAHPFVPDDFVVPQRLTVPAFSLRMLSIHDVVKDYDAVMTSLEHLQKHFSVVASQHSVFGDHWPSADLSLMDDLSDLGWHQTEFKKRTSFTYTVMTTDDTQCLGCVYILPPERETADAEIYLWVRASAYPALDALLFETVQEWIARVWPFTKVSYPGRT